MRRKPGLHLTPLIALLVTVFITSLLHSQPPYFRTYNYIEKYAEEAKEQMLLYGIPASVTMAQAILESRCGTSDLAIRSNNHFGIKCHNSWGGDTIHKDDDSANECFRKYNNIKESYTDHSLFLLSRPWYQPLFKLAKNDYKSWCYGLKSAGYATNKDYAAELIKLIESASLHELDNAEVLPVMNEVLPLSEKEIIPQPSKYHSVWALAIAGLLFTDEKEVAVQSLSLYAPCQKNGAVLTFAGN